MSCRGRACSRAASRSSMPSPVCADTTTQSRSRSATAFTVIGSATSDLLTTTSSGTPAAPISRSTSRTAPSCASGSGSEPSTTCRIRSACATSSSVARNASTSWCGRCRTKPTVSVSVNCLPPGVRAWRTAESSVANSESATSTPDPVSRLSRLDLPAVGLDLRLAGAAGPDAAAAGHPPAGLAGQRLAPAAQPGQQVLQLGQLDLRLALLAAGVLSEDVQDQRGAVDHLHPDDALEAAQLARAELAVADHRVGADLGHDLGELGSLPGPHVGGRIRPAATLDEAVEYLGSRGLGELGQLAQRIFGAGQSAVGPHADEHDPLEAQLPVFDLADVLELGGHPGDPAERCPVLQVQLTRVGRGG